MTGCSNIMLDRMSPPDVSAACAGLRYVADRDPGIRRVAHRKGFRYLDRDGRPIRDKKARQRINSLAIPPAWTDVWICPDPNGHLQATGRDAAGRKQYRYHPRWREVRDENKYGRLLAFGETLPRIREQVEKDLSGPGLSREKVLAAVVRLLDTSYIRIGNAAYARQNGSYGLTTLQVNHVRVGGESVEFNFRGKSGKNHRVKVHDKKLARVIKRCRDLPGEELFEYLDDDGELQKIGSHDVNHYLREVSGAEFSAKDFRTWAGSVLALLALREVAADVTSATDARHKLVEAVKTTAKELGNTPAVCRRCYIHPAVVEAFEDGALAKPSRLRSLRTSLRQEEQDLLALLRRTRRQGAAAA